MKENLLKSLSVVLSLLMVLSMIPLGVFTLTASAETEYSEGYYTYTVNKEGEATITDVDTAISGKVAIPSAFGEYPVTTIGRMAFYKCSNLTGITIPDGIVAIGDSAFQQCTGLTSVTIPRSVTSIGYYAFSSCSGIESVYITDMAAWCCIDFKDYDSNPVYYADGLYLINNLVTNVVIPNGVTSIGNCAFYNYDNLTSVKISDSVTSIGDNAFTNCDGITSVTISDSVKTIGAAAFYNCYSLKNITIPNGVISIEDSAFYGCGLTSVIIPDSVTNIGSRAFAYCRNLTNATISDNIISVNDSAFYNCDLLTSITIPDSVKSIGDSAFYHCAKLENVTIGNNVKTIGKKAFSYCIRIESIKIPDSVTTIGESAFEDCNNLKSITISDSVMSIGNKAFAYCGYYKEKSNWENYVLYIGNHLIDARREYSNVSESVSGNYTIKEGTVTIADRAFSDCSNLTSVTIPNSVKSIGGYAFLRCETLTSVNFPDSVIAIGENPLSSTAYFNDASNWESGVLYVGKHLINVNGDIASEYEIKPGTLTMADCAFYGYGVTSITVPDSITKISDEAFAYCGNLTTITIPDSITKISDEAFAYCGNLTTITIPDSITHIGYDAFLGCDEIEGVYITDITAWCNIDFESYCSIPTSDVSSSGTLYLNGKVITGDVVLAEDVEKIPSGTFRNSTITSITIPDGITSIDDVAFEKCKKLKTIFMPKSVVSVSEDAFYGCDSLAYVWYTGSEEDRNNMDISPVNNNDLTNATWYYDICNPSDHKYDGDCDATCANCIWERLAKEHVFNNNMCTLCGYNKILEYITYDVVDNAINIRRCNTTISGGYIIPTTIEGRPVTSIGGWAFWGCSSLTSITIPNSVTSLGTAAFSNCASLTSVTIPDSVTSLGSYAFGGCDNLKNVTIGKGVTSIAENAFNDDYAMEKYVVDAKNTAYSSDENGVLFNKIKTQIIAYPSANAAKEYTIPQGVTDIVYFAFGNCDNLTKVNMPESVKSIDVDSFRDCDNLRDVVIPTTVKNIEENAFFGCDNLDDVWYSGSEQNKSDISIKAGNELLEVAEWHYNTCKNGEHQYTDSNDKTCENCDWSLAKPGDINDDGAINNKDLGLLMQSLNGWKVGINADAADVNGDGRINNKDYGLLMQYCNGWNVKLL